MKRTNLLSFADEEEGDYDSVRRELVVSSVPPAQQAPQQLFPAAAPTIEEDHDVAVVPKFTSFVKPPTDVVEAAPVQPTPSTKPKASDYFNTPTSTAVEEFLATIALSTNEAPAETQRKKRKREEVIVIEDESSSSSSSERRKKKRKKKSKSTALVATKSMADKMKMLELDLAHNKEDRRTSSQVLVEVYRPDKIYFLDRFGDKSNLQFGLYRMDIPMFYRLSKICLGLAPYYKVKWSKDNKTFTLIDLRYQSDPDAVEKSVRYHHISRREMRQQEEEAIRLYARKGSAADSFGEFVRLPSDAELDRELKASMDYSSNLHENLRKKAKEFNERTRSEPSNIKMWLDFVNFQDEYIKLGASDSGRRSVAFLLEKKIEIFKKALETNPHSLELLLGYLRCCEQLYDSEKVQQIWTETVASHPDLPSLWQAYMTFIQSNFTSFTMTQFRQSYTTALQALDKQKRIYYGSPKYKLMEERMIAIFNKAVFAEKQAGYIERAVAMMQALIEFNVFTPKSILKEAVNERDVNMDALKAYFQAFWDSDVPRFGENNAAGWASWHESAEAKVENVTAIIQDYDPLNPTEDMEELQQRELEELKRLEEQERELKQEVAVAAGPAPTAKLQQEPDFSENVAEIARWFEHEQNEDSSNWYPLRPSELTEIEEDPHRAVLFEDVRDSLFLIRTEDLKRNLIINFIDLLGMPIEFEAKASNHSSTIEKIEMTMESIGDAFRILDDVEFPPQCSEEGEFGTVDPIGEARPGEAMQKLQKSYSQLCISLDRYVVDRSLSIINDIPSDTMKQTFLRNCIAQALKAFKEDKDFCQELIVAKLLLEGGIAIQKYRSLHGNSKEPVPASIMKHARDVAKSLLKQDSMNLKLWRAYAFIESCSGNLKETRKVYDMALANASKLPPSVQVSLPLLVRAYVDFELSVAAAGGNTSARAAVLPILMSLAEKSFSPSSKQQAVASTRVLKGKKTFEVMLQSYKSEFDKLFQDSKQQQRSASAILAQQAGIALPTALSAQQRALAEIVRDFIYCYAVFEHVTASTSVSAGDTTVVSRAMQIFDIGMALFGDGAQQELAFYHEQLLEAKLKLLAIDTLHPQSTTPPNVLRNTLRSALAMYPTNKLVLSLLLYSERKSQMTGRLRRIFDELLSSPTSTFVHPQLVKSSSILWLYAIRSETKRGSGQRIRSLYEKALQVGERLSPVLWKTYIDFEIQHGQVQSAKGVFYRAIRNVPWNKSLWLHSLHALSAHLNTTEISDLVRLLTEKEIRLRSIPAI